MNSQKLGPERRSGLTLLELVAVVSILAVLASMVVPMIDNIMFDSRNNTALVSMAKVRELITNVYSQHLGSRRPTIGSSTVGDGDDLGSVPLYIRDLFVQPTLPLRYQYLVLNGYNSEANLGWNGPYLQHSGARYKVDTLNNFTPDYGTDLDPAIKDSWGHPLVLQWPTFSGLTDNQQALTAKWRYGRVVSAGPNGKIDTPLTSTVSNASSDLDFYPSMAECGDDLVLFINAPDRRQ